MVRCLVSDGWGERVGGGDDDKRKKKKKRVFVLGKRKRVCCVLLSATVLFPYERLSIFKEHVFGAKSNNVTVVASNLQYGTFNSNIGSASSSGMADNSQKTEDFDTDDKNNQCLSTVSWCNGVGNEALVVVESKDQCKTKGQSDEHKTLRRLMQNREAARKSRLRKKAYVQQLENSRLRLAQIEHELQQVRQQGTFVAPGVTADHGHSIVGNSNAGEVMQP
ncbi:basic leucine zipper transcription factor [Medicago truncatula]|uniref:Basic leucine zipper transcription factor n=1 Tax=Medicago truncatula TaxID=3880 RepID=A0A072VQF8_MEDTR|nr:basic leucine zipper transcription factor [Medicago truncatula]